MVLTPVEERGFWANPQQTKMTTALTTPRRRRNSLMESTNLPSQLRSTCSIVKTLDGGRGVQRRASRLALESQLCIYTSIRFPRGPMALMGFTKRFFAKSLSGIALLAVALAGGSLATGQSQDTPTGQQPDQKTNQKPDAKPEQQP